MMTQKQRDLLLWVLIVIALFLTLYWTEQGERSKVAGRILAVAAISYKTHDTHNKLKK